MILLCALSKHVAAPVDLANQGFQFSRCQRCHRDLIRSSSWPDADWTVVPTGFRVAWRDTDMTALHHAGWAERQWQAARGAATTAVQNATLLRAVAGELATDAAAALTIRARRAAGYGKRVVRLPFARRPIHPWIVIVNLSLGRDLRLEDATTLMSSLPPGTTVSG